MKRIRFIINPVSGVANNKKKKIEQLIEKHLDKSIFIQKIKYTRYSGHANQLSKKGKKKGYDVIVAVGGDGSVNDVCRPLIQKNPVLGIIPAGSGNGLARCLQIPMNLKKAVGLLNTGKIRTIDSVTVNDQIFVNCAGMGFDADIAHRFSKYKRRGFKSYIWLTLTEFLSYKPEEYHFTADGKTIETKAFIITFANSSQYGNNVYIAPDAKIDDGLLDITIVKPFPFYQVFILAYRLLRGTINQSQYVECLKAREVKMKRPGCKIYTHMDGEPIAFENEIKLTVNPLSLKVIVP